MILCQYQHIIHHLAGATVQYSKYLLVKESRQVNSSYIQIPICISISLGTESSRSPNCAIRNSHRSHRQRRKQDSENAAIRAISHPQTFVFLCGFLLRGTKAPRLPRQIQLHHRILQSTFFFWRKALVRLIAFVPACRPLEQEKLKLAIATTLQSTARPPFVESTKRSGWILYSWMSQIRDRDGKSDSHQPSVFIEWGSQTARSTTKEMAWYFQGSKSWWGFDTIWLHPVAWRRVLGTKIGWLLSSL